jgi:Cys-tRNA(Pro)/Cys-tRNA(Cys) deacylase
MDQPPVSIALEELGVPHRIFQHETPVTSLEQAASDRGQRPSQIVRTILFRVTENEFALVLAAGPKTALVENPAKDFRSFADHDGNR